jgi:outer membrane protein
MKRSDPFHRIEERRVPSVVRTTTRESAMPHGSIPVRLASLAAAALLLTTAPARAQTTGAAPGAPADRSAPSDTIPPPPETGERWSLARSVATALERSGDVRVARARTRQASGSALAAWSNILPSASVGAARGRVIPGQGRSVTEVQLDDSTVTTAALNQSDNTSLFASLETNIISLPGWSEKRRQNHLLDGAESDEAETRNSVVFRVKQQYFTVLKAERLAEVSRESERLARDEEARAEALFQVGTVARGDVLKARARRAQTQLDRIRAYNQVKIQTEVLKQVIGVDPATPLSVEPILEQEVALPDSAASIRNALDRRPRLESAEALERAAKAGVFGSWTQRLPRLTGAVSTARVKRTDEIELTGVGTQEFEGTSTESQGELRVSMPIFDGLAIEGNIRRARGIQLEAEASRRQLELDVAVEVQQAWLGLREAAERIAVAREGLASAEEDYNFSKSRYEVGAGTFLDLLNAQVVLSQARQSLVEAQADARIAEADLERAVGERRY